MKRTLTFKQIKYLINNAHLSNRELAKKLKTKPGIVATYKSRARKNGIELPKYVMPPRRSSINIIKEIASKQNKE